jgi:hypothetical protein
VSQHPNPVEQVAPLAAHVGAGGGVDDDTEEGLTMAVDVDAVSDDDPREIEKGVELGKIDDGENAVDRVDGTPEEDEALIETIEDAEEPE